MRFFIGIIFVGLTCTPALSASVCIDRKATISIAQMTVQAADIEINTDGNKSLVPILERKISILAHTYCASVDAYPAASTVNKILMPDGRDSSCQLFSADIRQNNGMRHVYWSKCPQSSE
jgi:hypothetical protein